MNIFLHVFGKQENLFTFGCFPFISWAYFAIESVSRKKKILSIFIILIPRASRCKVIAFRCVNTICIAIRDEDDVKTCNQVDDTKSEHRCNRKSQNLFNFHSPTFKAKIVYSSRTVVENLITLKKRHEFNLDVIWIYRNIDHGSFFDSAKIHHTPRLDRDFPSFTLPSTLT